MDINRGAQHDLGYFAARLMKRGICRMSSGDVLRATPPMLSVWPCKLKLDEKKLKLAYLIQENGFCPTILHNLLRLVEGITKLKTL
jgi:hypothetical protein